MSPELLVPESFGLKESRPTKQSDCYALGMVVYEVLSGLRPFGLATDPHVIYMVLEGRRPGRPQTEWGSPFTDAIWALLELCWKANPSDRASVKAVLRGLEGSPLPAEMVSYVDEGVETTTDYQSDDETDGSGMFLHFASGSPLIILTVHRTVIHL